MNIVAIQPGQMLYSPMRSATAPSRADQRRTSAARDTLFPLIARATGASVRLCAAIVPFSFLAWMFIAR